MSVLRDSFRRWGHLQADLDPLGRLAPLPCAELDEARGGEADRLRKIYCGSIGAEFMHIPDPERREWVARRLEEEPAEPDRSFILKRLAMAEVFELFLHSRYVGTKRFSIEGCTALIPALDSILESAGAEGVKSVLIAMSHRGRLNVMAHIVGTPDAKIFAGFEDVNPRSVLGSGDVRHHLGATGTYATRAGEALHVHLVANPSHLEAVSPVVMGRARARQQRIGTEGIREVLPITIHGDASLAGQGIAAEALNLAFLPGYRVGGTVHVVVNNLVGFTTEPVSLHSSRYATDVALRLPIPILHVNGEDMAAVDRAGRILHGYRHRFESDVMLDLYGFRRYGHSEVDDPTTSQPLLYRRIEDRPPFWRTYGRSIGVGEGALADLEEGNKICLLEALEEARSTKERPVVRELPGHWDPYHGGCYEPRFDEVETAVGEDVVREITESITTVPEGFTLHPKVKKGLERRREMGLGKLAVDWGMAEALAFGSLLREGTPVRLAGEDSRRGTFNHRHSIHVDYETGEEYVPLAHVHPGQAWFETVDSPLSEAAAIGFEYGFSREYPDGLVLWEAQFGDFANGGQVIIDQFVSAGEDKWDVLSGLVLLLPHGYEGQGPEHSSARPERFLQLEAENNIQVCQPSTAGQYFHLLRRQVLRRWRKPLVVMMPKSQLRATAACSPLAEITSGRFSPVLADREVRNPSRILLCTGKLVHDLRLERMKRGDRRTAIIAIEQLAPWPEEEVRDVLARAPGVEEIVWVQEEPANMGALQYVKPKIEVVAHGRRVRSVKRSASSSPATGSARAHQLEMKRLLELAFTPVV